MNLSQNVMILQRELCLCKFHIIYWLLYDPGGGAFASSRCPRPGKFANLIKKNAYARGWGGMGTGRIDRCIIIYTLLYGLTYNTRGYFVSCVVYEQRAKCPHVLYVKPYNKGFIIPLLTPWF